MNEEEAVPTSDPGTGRARRGTHEAVILSGGKGVRLRPYPNLLPEPLVPTGDEHSVLEVVLRQLADQDFAKATLAISDLGLGQIVRAFVGDGSQVGIAVDYVGETSPLGTIWPVLAALDDLPENFLVMSGDTLTDLDYADLLASHERSGASLTVAIYQREHQPDLGPLDPLDQHFESFAEASVLSCSISMGIYAVSREALLPYRGGLPLGFDELMLDLVERGTPPATYRFDGYWLEIGRPDETDETEWDVLTAESHSVPSG
ncbi:MAG TPA: nucleotidyltransferase family protein [Acidimicrobiales bacterium]|nr:nucleotidyltransferase family protein [Acidimicrobiales bacterium]